MHQWHHHHLRSYPSCRWRPSENRFNCTWGCSEGLSLTIRRHQVRAHSRGRCRVCLGVILRFIFRRIFACRLVWSLRLRRRAECTLDFRRFMAHLRDSTKRRSPYLTCLGWLPSPSKTLSRIFAISSRTPVHKPSNFAASSLSTYFQPICKCYQGFGWCKPSLSRGRRISCYRISFAWSKYNHRYHSSGDDVRCFLRMRRHQKDPWTG